MSGACSCFSADANSNICYLKNETFVDGNGDITNPDNWLPNVELVTDNTYSSGCGNQVYPNTNIIGNDLLCSDQSDGSSSWQKKVYEYGLWMFDHQVAFDEMVYVIKKYLLNVSDHYFIIIVYKTGDEQS